MLEQLLRQALKLVGQTSCIFLHKLYNMALYPVSSIRPRSINNNIDSISNLSYNNIGPAPSIIDEIQHKAQKALLYEKEYFPGACYACGAMPSVTGVPVLWCTGCQLVAYCNKNCQRADWKIHKIVCKTFPVEMGKNIIVRQTESCTDYGSFYLALYEFDNSFIYNADSLKQYRTALRNLILNPHMCNVCLEAQTEKLFDCRCCAVSYCSELHRKMDTNHLSKDCDVLYGRAMANWYLTQHCQLLIPDGLLNEVNLYDGINLEKVSKLSKYSSEKWLEAIVYLINNSLTYPLTILHALKNFKLGEERKGLSEITSLTIHIVHNAPMLGPRMWEIMLHQLPNLKILNLTFINRNMILTNPYKSNLSVERCSDCKRKQRVINYNIQRIHYHEYFSSDEYVEPDVVAVFGTFNELLSGICFTEENIEKAERFTSQGNMTYSKHTVVILTDAGEDLLEGSVKSFYDARPVKVLFPVQENPASIFCIRKFAQKKIVNPCRYLCCLQRNH